MEQYLKTPIDLLFDKFLNPTDKLVLQYLLWRQGENSQCWPAVRTIKDDLSLGINTVQRSIKRLVKSGKLSIQKPDKRGRSHSNSYTVIVSKRDTIATGNCIQNEHSIVSKTDTAIVSKRDTEKKPYKIHHKNTPYGGDSIELKLASLLLEKILNRKPDFKKPDLQSWAREIDLMIRRDSRKPENIEKVILWCQADSGGSGKWAGWQDVILSTAKLREKFDQLDLKMQNEKQSGKNRRDFSETAASKFGQTVRI